MIDTETENVRDLRLHIAVLALAELVRYSPRRAVILRRLSTVVDSIEPDDPASELALSRLREELESFRAKVMRDEAPG